MRPIPFTAIVTSVVLASAVTPSASAQTASKLSTKRSPTTQAALPSQPRVPNKPVAQRQLTISVDWGDAMTTRESGLWIGYLFARMDFISRNGGRYNRVPGAIAPLFDEEVFARGEAAKIYRNLKKQNKAMESPYFNELEKVDAAGFMPEYVWQYHKRSEWALAPTKLRTADFDRWSRQNLAPNHAPETRGRVVFTTSQS
jgi:hypothetical protein